MGESLSPSWLTESEPFSFPPFSTSADFWFAHLLGPQMIGAPHLSQVVALTPHHPIHFSDFKFSPAKIRRPRHHSVPQLTLIDFALACTPCFVTPKVPSGGKHSRTTLQFRSPPFQVKEVVKARLFSKVCTGVGFRLRRCVQGVFPSIVGSKCQNCFRTAKRNPQRWVTT